MNGIDPILIALPLISLCAFFIKGVIGTGTSTVTVALASFMIDPKIAIVLVSLVNVFGGLSMIKVDPISLPKPFWIPITITMIIGSIIGALALSHIDNNFFQIILGFAFLLSAFWFFFNTNTNAKQQMPRIKEKATIGDLITGLFSGFCGGFIAINAPPLILYFGRFLNKRALRRLFVVIFIPSAIAQTITFWFSGLLNIEILTYALLMMPGMFLGIYAGNKSFHRISEAGYKKILSVLLTIVSVRLIYLGILSL